VHIRRTGQSDRQRSNPYTLPPTDAIVFTILALAPTTESADFLNTSPFTILDYSFHVAKVIRQTENFMGFRPERVLVMTDETDEEWLYVSKVGPGELAHLLM
jgi:hypothetical protein